MLLFEQNMFKAYFDHTDITPYLIIISKKNTFIDRKKQWS